METKEALKELIDIMPEEKVKIALDFLEWLQGEKLTAKELVIIKKGERGIRRRESVRWRDVRRT